MRRHPALQPLSRDHHDVLLHARRLRGEEARVPVPIAVERFLRYHDAVLVHHFREEEDALLPHLPPEVAARLVAEHDDLRRRAARLRAEGGAAGLGEALRAHVRHEEDAVFRHLQDALPEPGLVEVGQRAAAVRAALRPTAGHGEDCFLA